MKSNFFDKIKKEASRGSIVDFFGYASSRHGEWKSYKFVSASRGVVRLADIRSKNSARCFSFFYNDTYGWGITSPSNRQVLAAIDTVKVR